MFRRASLNQFSFLPTYFTPNFSVIVMGVLRRQLTFVCLILAIISVGLTAQSAEIRPWQEYRTIMWVGDTAYKNPGKLGLFYQRLREMGINTAMVHGDGDIKPILDNKFPYYVENMVNRGLCLKFSSKVTDWDKFVTDWVRNGRPESALVRDYCLDSTEWQSWARKEIQQLARKNRDRNPVAYNIRDELSTTISANPFDYDFNPIALSGFRSWLKTQYADVAALNAEWETKFRDWDEVKPFTTDEIKNRMASGTVTPRGKPDWQELQAVRFDPVKATQAMTRWNFSPWADFRTYMDLSLARVLSQLRQAAHEVDPLTPVGVEGTQMPSAFGGYDLWRLSQALDWVEPYDIGNAREIFGSFMPGKPLLTTVFESDTLHASRRLWHLLLQGDRGCIIWWSEDCIDWKSSDYSLTAKAKALAPVLNELRSPLAALFLKAEPEYDPVFIHYSQPSIQVDWLMESTVDGSTWLRRFSSFEAEHNKMAQVRNGWVKVFQDIGFSPRFISSEQMVSGLLPKVGPSVLVLPTDWALSGNEAAAIQRFVNSTGKSDRAVITEVTPGMFDEHGKLRNEPALASFFPVTAEPGIRIAQNDRSGSHGLAADIGRYAAFRGGKKSGEELSQALAKQLKFLQPFVSIPDSACVRTYRYRLGPHRLLAFERNINYQMSEDLKQAGGNERFEKSLEVDAQLHERAHVYELNGGKYLGYLDKIHFTLEPWRPSLFAITSQKIASDSLIQVLAEIK